MADTAGAAGGRATQAQEGLTTAVGPSVEPQASAPGAPAVDPAAESDGQQGFETSASEGGPVDENLDVVRQWRGARLSDGRH
jgi:hypothetical protein